MTLRLTIIALLLTTLTAGAWTQQMLMREAYARRGAAPAVVIGNAIDLDGSSEYLSDGNTTLLNGVTQVTYVAWVNVATNKFNGGVVMSRGTLVHGLTQNNALQFYIVVGGYLAGATLPTNQWHMLCGTWSAGQYIKFYTNGVLASEVTSGAFTNIATLAVNDNFEIGRDDLNAAYKYEGLIDEVAIFSQRCLSSVDVAELYASGTGKRIETLSTGTNGLIRLWHLDESGSASNAYDSASGTTATGTAIGTGDWVTGKVPK